MSDFAITTQVENSFAGQPYVMVTVRYDGKTASGEVPVKKDGSVYDKAHVVELLRKLSYIIEFDGDTETGK